MSADSLNRFEDEIPKPVVMLTEDEARVLTAKIVSFGGTLTVLLHEAYDKQAWKALGYGSFATYCKAEFDMSKTRAYQMLKYAVVTEQLALAADVELSTIVDSIPESHVRSISLDDLEDFIREAFVEMPADADSRSKVVTELLRALYVKSGAVMSNPQAPGTTKTTTTTTTSPPADDAPAEDRGEGEPAPASGDTLAAPDPASENAEANAAGDAGGQPEANDMASGAAGPVPPSGPAAKDGTDALAVALEARKKLNAAMKAMDAAGAVPLMDAEGRISFAGTLAAVQDWVNGWCDELENAPGLTLVQGAAS